MNGTSRVYELRIRGAVSRVARAMFDDVQVSVADGHTVLLTTPIDSAALYGLISRIESLGLVLTNLAVQDVREGRHQMTQTVDDLGPVDWVVVEFPGSKFNGEIAPILRDYVERNLIKVLDLLIIKKDNDGGFEAFELSDLEDGELGELRAHEAQLAMLLSEQDVADLAETIEPGSSGAVLVWENVWAAPFASAVRHAGGQLVASGRIPIQALVAALEADATASTEGA